MDIPTLVTAHPRIAVALAIVACLDHVLAAIPPDMFKPNSTAGLLLHMFRNFAEWIADTINKSKPAALLPFALLAAVGMSACAHAGRGAPFDPTPRKTDSGISRGASLFMAVALFLGMGVLAGCAPGILGAQQGLAAAEQTAAASVQAFEKFDHDHQIEIAGNCAGADPAPCRAALEAYRSKRKGVQVAIASLDAGFTAAHTGIAAKEGGVAAIELAALLGDIWREANALYQAIAALKAP